MSIGAEDHEYRTRPILCASDEDARDLARGCHSAEHYLVEDRSAIQQSGAGAARVEQTFSLSLPGTDHASCTCRQGRKKEPRHYTSNFMRCG